MLRAIIASFNSFDRNGLETGIKSVTVLTQGGTDRPERQLIPQPEDPFNNGEQNVATLLKPDQHCYCQL